MCAVSACIVWAWLGVGACMVWEGVVWCGDGGCVIWQAGRKRVPLIKPD